MELTSFEVPKSAIFTTWEEYNELHYITSKRANIALGVSVATAVVDLKYQRLGDILPRELD